MQSRKIWAWRYILYYSGLFCVVGYSRKYSASIFSPEKAITGHWGVSSPVHFCHHPWFICPLFSSPLVYLSTFVIALGSSIHFCHHPWFICPLLSPPLVYLSTFAIAPGPSVHFCHRPWFICIHNDGFWEYVTLISLSEWWWYGFTEVSDACH